MDPSAGLGAAFLVFGVGRLWIWSRRRQWVRDTALQALDARRAVYTEIPTHRQLADGEMIAERNALDATSNGFPKFERLADYIDEYPPTSRLAMERAPIRVIIDVQRTTVALVFRPLGSTVVRIHLVTELGDGRWLLTENNEDHAAGKLVRPSRFEVLHVKSTASPAAMISEHAERLAEIDATRPVPIGTFHDYVASHERRWDAIRAHRKEIGWIAAPAEIAWAPGTSAASKDAVFAEIRRLTDAERS